MYKVASALLLAAVSIAPAQAATTIIVNPGNTALPSYTTAGVFQDFNSAGTGVRQFVPNSTVDNTVIAPNVATEQSNAMGVTVRDASLAGMDQDYLALANTSWYTISFLQPVAFFSFAFNLAANRQAGAFVTLNYDGGGSETFSGSGIFGPTGTTANFGRVSYDVGSDPRISSVMIGKTAVPNTNRFSIDDIASAVPEPATWLMMILGFGLVGSQLRRRKGRVTLAAA